ncbi:MAG: hypothetical protein C0503_08210 [Gemmatimonas sp.]|nr:hypothetical protein [Gemmatimonas sp.]
MIWLRRVVLLVLGGLAAWGLAASSAVDLPWHGANAAALRLSWVARPERIETCRDLTREELDERPAHMRQARECVGASATYRLSIAVDGQPAVERVLRGAGLRNDRAIFVLDEHPVAPGARRVAIRFTRVEPFEAPMDSTDVRRGAVPRDLALDTVVTIPSTAVALVSLVDGRLALKLP